MPDHKVTDPHRQILEIRRSGLEKPNEERVGLIGIDIDPLDSLLILGRRSKRNHRTVL